MRSKMKGIVCMTLGVAVSLLVGASMARADEGVRATVPFNFTAGNVRLPAGTYQLKATDEAGIVLIASADGKHSMFVLTIPIAPEKVGAQPELVFERVGQNYFLERIVGFDEGHEIPLKPALLEHGAEKVALLVSH
jgi:hypothetical protein